MGIFVKVLNNFTRAKFGDGPWVEFHYAKGKHAGYFQCLVMGKK